MKSYLIILVVLVMAGCATNKENTKSAGSKTAKKEMVAGKKEAKKPSAGAVKCSLKTDARVLEIVAVKKGCELLYTKFGETNSIATAVNSVDYCQATQDRIQGKLEEAGFSCK